MMLINTPNKRQNVNMMTSHAIPWNRGITIAMAILLLCSCRTSTSFTSALLQESYHTTTPRPRDVPQTDNMPLGQAAYSSDISSSDISQPTARAGSPTGSPKNIFRTKVHSLSVEQVQYQATDRTAPKGMLLSVPKLLPTTPLKRPIQTEAEIKREQFSELFNLQSQPQQRLKKETPNFSPSRSAFALEQPGRYSPTTQGPHPQNRHSIRPVQALNELQIPSTDTLALRLHADSADPLLAADQPLATDQFSSIQEEYLALPQSESLVVMPPEPEYQECEVYDAPPAPCASCQLPKIGPSDEYICDGGDFGLPAAVQKNWTLDGLEQEDTIAHYDTLDGRVVVKPSNRVCIYAPRFGAVRHVANVMASTGNDRLRLFQEKQSLSSAQEKMQLATSLQRNGPSIGIKATPAGLLNRRQQAGVALQEVALSDLAGGLSPLATLEVMHTNSLNEREAVLIAKRKVAALTWTGDQAVQLTLDARGAIETIGETSIGKIFQTKIPNSPKLRLLKLASTGAAHSGDEIEFTLRFDNIGDQTIGNVTIADNLSSRLVYVKGSAKCSMKADFKPTKNEHSSLIMRWEINQPIKPNEGGLITFRCKVR